MTHQTSNRKLAALSLFFALLALGVAALGTADSSAEKAKPQAGRSANPHRNANPEDYVGGDACFACHEDVTKNFAGTRHGRAMEFGGWGEVRCQSCHGDATEHVATADAAKIKNPSTLPLLEQNDTCLGCHANQPHTRFWSGGPHDTSNVACLDCHSVHHAKSREKLLTKATEEELCFTCHADQRKAKRQRSTHFFRDEWGRSQQSCNSCHNAHGTQTAQLLKANSTNDLCWICHQDKRGPFLWEHPPVKEDCLVCHNAHGSDNPNLLTRRTMTLCQSCHLQGRHQTIAGRTNSMWNINRQCLNCHPQVHGSNHPSGVNLQR